MPSAAHRSPLYGRAEEVRRLITEEGFTLPAIGERYGMSTPAVRAFCKRNAIGERAACGRPRQSPLSREMVRQGIREGKTLEQIGAAVGLTKGAVAGFCSRNRIKVERPQGRNLNAVAERGGSRTTQRKIDRGFDGRALGYGGTVRTTRQKEAQETRKMKDQGAIAANCKTAGVLAAMTVEERAVKRVQIENEMAGLLRAAADYAATLGAGIPLRDVREGRCRYPLWPEGSADHRVCGRPVAGERSYCACCAGRTLYYVAPDLRAPRDPNVIRRKW